MKNDYRILSKHFNAGRDSFHLGTTYSRNQSETPILLVAFDDVGGISHSLCDYMAMTTTATEKRVSVHLVQQVILSSLCHFPPHFRMSRPSNKGERPTRRWKPDSIVLRLLIVCLSWCLRCVKLRHRIDTYGILICLQFVCELAKVKCKRIQILII